MATLMKLRTTAVLRLFEAKSYISDRKGPAARAGKKNVLIFGQGRAGTTLFENLMVSTGYFTGHHEVLNTVTREVFCPTAFVRGLGRMAPSENIIVHVKPEHLGRARRKRGPVDARAFLKALLDDGWIIVHIQRRDILRQMVSKYVAKARGGFHKVDDRAETVFLTIPENDFIKDYERRLGWLEEEERLLKGLPHLNIFYESDLETPEGHQITVDRVLDQLGLERRPVSTQLRKISSTSPSDHLANRMALQEAFDARGWEWTL